MSEDVTIKSLREIPPGMYNASRYDTADEYVLSVWISGRTWDIREPKVKGLSDRVRREDDEPVKFGG